MEAVSLLALAFVLTGSLQKLRHHLQPGSRSLSQDSFDFNTSSYPSCPLFH
jgi:hypothetical protein